MEAPGESVVAVELVEDEIVDDVAGVVQRSQRLRALGPGVVDREMIRPAENPGPQQARVVGLHEECGAAAVGLRVEGEVRDNGMVDVYAEQTLVCFRLDQRCLIATR